MKVLVINAGSSSLKFTLFNMERQEMLATGQVERLGLAEPHLIYKRHDGQKAESHPEIKTHTEAMRVVCDQLTDPELGVLENREDITAIGHRVVHGGETVTRPVLIDENVKDVIKACFSLAPLHNPPNMAGIEASEQLFPGVPNIAVFDTAFHQTMPPEAFLYAVPYELYEEHGVRRYGFHGTSHHFVAQAAAELLGEPFDKVKLITCHLGNGCSMAAVRGGKVEDTTMGMTPLEGLVMGTRCGDIDPAVVIRLAELGRSPAEIDKLLNKQSGLLGVSCIGSSDMRDVIKAADEGNERADRALKMFVRRIVKYVGAYFTLLDGAHVVFTGGIGEYSVPIRERVVSRLEALGIRLDKERNQGCQGTPGVISTDDSRWKALAVPTNEELMIGRQVVEVIKSA